MGSRVLDDEGSCRDGWPAFEAWDQGYPGSAQSGRSKEKKEAGIHTIDPMFNHLDMYAKGSRHAGEPESERGKYPHQHDIRRESAPFHAEI